MITNADAGLRWLDRSTPNLDRAKASFKLIIADGHRAGAVIESTRCEFCWRFKTRAPDGLPPNARLMLAR
jgi:hypothetical protein